jgi:hypothetical protein
MAVTINASTSAGLVQTADTSGVLALQTAGTTAVTVDASQNVGIGVTPSTWTSTKAIEVGSLGTALWSSGAGSTTLSNGAYYNSGWKYANATSKPSILDFDNAGKVTYYAATTTSTAGSAISLTQLLAVEAGKSIALQGATVQTGAGITFPATQVSSSDANTLDDYEEGTFTPTIIGLTSAGTGTYSNQTGSYVKVGQIVSIYIRIDWSAHTGTGNMGFGGLPFTTAGTYTNGAALNGMAGLTVPASCYVSANVAASATTGVFLAIPVGGGNDSQLAMDASGIVLFTITYRASA